MAPNLAHCRSPNKHTDETVAGDKDSSNPNFQKDHWSGTRVYSFKILSGTQAKLIMLPIFLDDRQRQFYSWYFIW
jgi:hypothetical protein